MKARTYRKGVLMKVKWFQFTPAPDGFDIIVRDQGADNAPILADVGVRGETFKKFVEEILAEGLDSINPPEAEQSTSDDWTGEPELEEPVKISTPEPEGETLEVLDLVSDVTEQ